MLARALRRGNATRCGLVLVAWAFGLAPAVALAGSGYQTQIVGVADPDLAARFRAASQLVAREGEVESESLLRQRAYADLQVLRKVAAAAGYHDQVMEFWIDTAQRPWNVIIDAKLGEPYRLAEVRVQLADGAPPPMAERLDSTVTGLVLGERAISASVIDADSRIARFYADRGWPFARIARRRAEIDRADHTMHVAYTIELGPKARFGAPRILGLRDVDREYVERQIAWRAGETYDRRLVDRTRQNLVASKLFSTVRVEPEEDVAADGQVTMYIDLVERLSRSVRGGVFYNSSEGFGARASWENRNLLGQAEDLRIEAEAGQSRFGLSSQFRRPAFLRPELDLVSQISTQQEMVDAYDRRNGIASIGLERRLSANLVGGAGLQLELAHVTDSVGTRTDGYVGVPLYFRYDTTNDLLNPTEGLRAGMTVTPNIAYLGQQLAFVSTKLSASTYQALDDDKRFVLASFGAVGSILGAERDRLSRDKRLFAGGGALRGYGFQRAGPLGADGDPLGGASLVELGVELRAKITEAIGVATFLDGGNVYDGLLPDPSNGLFRGVGLGLRYYSPVGPIRIDLAFPLDRRSTDDAFQFYVSIGQAF